MDEIETYLAAIPEARKPSFLRLLNIVKENLPEGFKISYNYGMIGFIVPLSRYPEGYHVKANTPLPFINLANQKNFIALYHMGLYANKELMNWFVNEFPSHSKRKLDMGKSCVRFKKPQEIPFALIKELVQKMTCEDWIACYESQINR
ncbi:DUF1801 domain-containing protein [Crocinitomicaceae bacterium]|nr:DUF1801 domain-containing protein [Crocinitomicaceae bacterium]